MAQDLFSIVEVASGLGLHVKTVRNFVRDGRLKATRIGKQYRIARADLEAFTGQSAAAFDRTAVRRNRHAEVSSVVQIDAVSPDLAERIGKALYAAAAPQGDPPSRVETIYDDARGRGSS